MQILSEEQLVGQTLGNYRIEHLVGKGQLTAVYLARHMGEQRVDALTLYLMPESFSNESHRLFLSRFRKEAALISTLDHPHILPVYAHGEVSGYPYLVTPYMMHGSLGDLVKQQGRIEHSQVRLLLHQIVEGLSYAHTRGFIHGTLKPSNIVWRRDDSLQVAGFGLMHMLQRSGIEQGSQQYAHLLSVANTFLAAPEYIAPEVVAGQSIDQRSDIYAVGCILFELLSGRPPFTGSKPLEVALQHASMSPASLRTVCPDVPITLALVVAQAMMRDPEQRFQNVNELDEAFAQASLGSTQHNLPSVKVRHVNDFTTGQHNTTGQRNTTGQHSATGKQNATGSWQFLPPIVTGRLPSVQVSGGNIDTRLSKSTRENTDRPFVFDAPEQAVRGVQRPETGSYTVPAPPTLPPPMPTPAAAVVQPKPVPEMKAPATKELKAPVTKNLNGVPMPGVTLAGDLDSDDELMKTYNWWSEPHGEKPAAKSATAKAAAPIADPKPLVLPATDTLDWGLENVNSSNRKRKSTVPLSTPKRKMKRRRVIALLGTGVVAAGIGASVAFKMHDFPGFTSMQQAMQSSPTTTGTNSSQKTAKKTGAPTTATHTGTVVAEQTLAKNSAALFTNPADKQSSLVVHLASGKFVAYEQACTHQGVHVNYDPTTQLLKCPAHGAIFDPAKNGAVVQGPATTPIASVKINVNSDGTITV